MRSVRLAIALLLLAAPWALQADPIKFSWESNGSSATLFSGEGYFIIDDDDIVAGFGNYAARISSFEFSWMTSNGNFSSSSANGDAVAQGFLNFDAALDLIGFQMCFSIDGACSAATSAPLILFRSGNDPLWGGTSGPNMPNFVRAAQTVTVAPAAVPEPGTLALLGIALAGLGLSRRRGRE